MLFEPITVLRGKEILRWRYEVAKPTNITRQPL
jgi:hypothetical protein